MPGPKPRRVAIAVRSWASEESVFVWTWVQKYFIRTGRDRDWLYIVHVNTNKDKSRDNWKAPGPTMPDLDRALQGYSYDIVELNGDTAAHTLVTWVEEASIDVVVISTGRSRRLPNPMQSRTTDYIAANAACSTLVIHPKMSLADLTRVHSMQQNDAQGIGSQRRVAYAEESQEGLNLMMQWAVSNCSRPDDHEFQVMINRNSMLARVSRYVAPATRRRPNTLQLAAAATSSGAATPFDRDPVVATALPPASEALPGGPPGPPAGGAATGASLSAPNSTSSITAGPSGTGGTLASTGGQAAAAEGSAEDAGGPAVVLKGKPSQVIQRFVKEHNIDLLVIPVTPQAALRRMDKESKRDLKPSKSFVYHKANCTCLCVPAHLLRHGAATATSSGLLLSEDEIDDDNSPAAIGSASGRLTHSPSPSRPSPDLHMRHMEPIIRPDAHISSQQPPAPPASEPPRGRYGSLSPPMSAEGEPRPRRSSAPQTRALAAIATSAAPPPSDSAPTAALATARSGGPLDEGSPKLASGAGGCGATVAGASAQGGAAAAVAGGSEGGRGLFSQLRSRVGAKLNINASRKESRECQPAPQVAPAVGASATDPDVTALDSQLADLQCVLQEGGLSGEVRERGANAVARARTLLATLSSETAALRSQLEEQEERRAAAMAALSGIGAAARGSGAGNGAAGGGGSGSGGGDTGLGAPLHRHHRSMSQGGSGSGGSGSGSMLGASLASTALAKSGGGVPLATAVGAVAGGNDAPPSATTPGSASLSQTGEEEQAGSL